MHESHEMVKIPKQDRSAKLPDHITIVETVTHSSHLFGMTSVLTRVSRPLENKAQAFSRFGNAEPDKFDVINGGWISDESTVGTVIISHEKIRRQLIPDEETKKDDNDRRLIIDLNGFKVLVVMGDMFRFFPKNSDDINKVKISATHSETLYKLFVIPR